MLHIGRSKLDVSKSIIKLSTPDAGDFASALWSNNIAGKPNVVPQISIMRFNTFIVFNQKQTTSWLIISGDN